MFAAGQVLSAVVMIGVYLFGMLLFYSFTVEVTDEELKFWFGIGLIHKTIALRDIQSTKAITNPW